MAAHVQTHLWSLQACLSVDEATGKRDPRTAVDLLGESFIKLIGSLHEKDVGFAASQIFNEQSGLLSFLKKSVSLDEFRDARTKCLDILLIFVERIAYDVQPYVLYIKDSFLNFYVMDKLASVKTRSLKLIEKVLYRYKETSGEEAKIKQLLEKILTEFASPSKLTSLVKQALYELLGTLAKKYPAEVVQYQEKLLNLFLRELKIQLTSKGKDPDQPVVSGCLIGLSHYLCSFTHGVEEDPVNSAAILNYACMVLKRTNVKKYEMTRAALQLLSENGYQFSVSLYDKHEEIYQQLEKFVHHNNRELKNIAIDTMASFLQQVALMLVEKAKENDPEARKIFQIYITKFHNSISHSSNPQDSFLAVKCYGSFALMLL